MIITLPLRTVNIANYREHWSKRAKRAKDHRGTTKIMLQSKFGSPPPPPLVVTITRVSPKLADDDGSMISCKACRDGIADWIGIDDGSDLVEWKYDRKNGTKKEYPLTNGYAVIVRIESK